MRNIELNRCRTAVWMSVLKNAARTSKTDRIEEAIASHLNADWMGSRNFAAFDAGRRLPFRHNQDPIPRDALWPRRAAKVWGETGDWFFTPFWFLVDDQKPVSLEQIGRCIQLLPLEHQEYLRAGVAGQVEEPFNLLPIVQSHICALSVPNNPWSLGTLTCARWRATRSGDGPAARWCGVGIVWLLLHLRESHGYLASHLEHLANFVLMQLASVKYQLNDEWPVEQSDLDQFELERKELRGSWSGPGDGFQLDPQTFYGSPRAEYRHQLVNGPPTVRRFDSD
jgi:hypothetical protein